MNATGELVNYAGNLTSLEMTSSFFWSSPWMLAAPCNPVKLEMPARCTNDAIFLHAREILDNTMVSSPSITPACSFFSNQVVSVVISYWLFCCCLGDAVSAATAAALTTPAAARLRKLKLFRDPAAAAAPRPATEPCREV